MVLDASTATCQVLFVLSRNGGLIGYSLLIYTVHLLIIASRGLIFLFYV